MGSKVTFIGHRNLIVKETEELLKIAIEEQIAQGRTEFMMGTHGEFDELALKACREIRETHPEIQIEVVLTSQNVIHKPDPWSWTPYKDVKTVMFDIENEHFKRRITVSNRKMIDECDVLICYVNVDAYKSGAKTAMNYAKRKGLEIINLRKQKEDPTIGMTEEEKKKYLEESDKKFKEEIKKFCEETHRMLMEYEEKDKIQYEQNKRKKQNKRKTHNKIQKETDDL